MCVWVEDADVLKDNSRELKIVYYNKVIKQYLDSKCRSLGIAGVKGQGKTFLIKVKRNLMGDGSMICFPTNRMVDTIDSSIRIDDSLLSKYLRDYDIWVSLWKYSICCSILSCKKIARDTDTKGLSPSTKNIIKENTKSEPSYVMFEVLNKNVKEVKNLLNDVGRLVFLVRGLNKDICFFIDKLDQTFSGYAKNFNTDSVMPVRSRNASVWQYAQYSLAEASYDLFNANNNIKVFFTIRHEALIDSECLNKDKARNINAFIKKLEYSKDDLKEMYDLYIRSEQKENLVSIQDKETEPSKAFIGLETIPHGYVEGINENVFDYIFRHTFKRPYDMMKICHALYSAKPKQKALSVKELRTIVNQEASGLLNMYLQELSIFLPCKIEEVYRLLAMTPGNVLNLALINQICKTHYIECDEQGIWSCNQHCGRCDQSPVFAVLYNIGLIGYYKNDLCDTIPTISFESISNRILNIHSFSLPKSSHYYLHPALSDKARDLRAKKGMTFIIDPNVVIGDCYEVRVSNNALYSTLKREKQEMKKERVFVSSTIKNLQEERDAIKDVLKQRNLHPVLSETEEFDPSDAQSLHSHDVCLDEVKKCKSFLFLIGEEYGGIYKGEKYKKQRDELIELSEGKIAKPSISLMEFYIARKSGLNCCVFASNNIEKMKQEETLNDEIKNEINFVNHFKLHPKLPIKGNWINWYKDSDDLKKRVKHHKF